MSGAKSNSIPRRSVSWEDNTAESLQLQLRSTTRPSLLNSGTTDASTATSRSSASSPRNQINGEEDHSLSSTSSHEENSSAFLDVSSSSRRLRTGGLQQQGRQIGQRQLNTIHSKHKGLRGAGSLQKEDKDKLSQNNTSWILFPWQRQYKLWWGFSCFMSVLTLVFETYCIAFDDFSRTNAIIIMCCSVVFWVDMGVNFNLAFVPDNGHEAVTDRCSIAQRYILSANGTFWLDLISVFPWYQVAYAIVQHGESVLSLDVDQEGMMDENSHPTSEAADDDDAGLLYYLPLLNLLHLVRIYRFREFVTILHFNTRADGLKITLARDLVITLLWTHIFACIMYYVARLNEFDPERSWLGDAVPTDVYPQHYERYVTALYWSITTFATVGYGDYSPVSISEKLICMIFMLLNLAFGAWIIGSITFLIVKQDEEAGHFRETVKTLETYAQLHEFDPAFTKRLRSQAKLYFSNHQLSDEQVLKNFPSSTRREVLRKLYLPSLAQSRLMNGVRQDFVDQFLSVCKVEIFNPGEDPVRRGSQSEDLYLLVEGLVKVIPAAETPTTEDMLVMAAGYESTCDSSELGGKNHVPNRQLGSGHFINQVGFLTEQPEAETVRTSTVCKTLAISRHDFKVLSENHLGSISIILENLLEIAEELVEEAGSLCSNLPRQLESFGSRPDLVATHSDMNDMQAELQKAATALQAQSTLLTCKDLIRMHITKLKDDQVTRFLFAASRGDTITLCFMCGQGCKWMIRIMHYKVLCIS